MHNFKDPLRPRAMRLPAGTTLASYGFTEDAEWRGLGTIPGSGAGIRQDFVHFDARARFTHVWENLTPPPPSACRCGWSSSVTSMPEFT